MKKLTQLIWLLAVSVALAGLAFPFAVAALQQDDRPAGQLISCADANGRVIACLSDRYGALYVINTSGAIDQDVNLTALAGTAVSVNNGTADAGTQRVAVASDNTPFKVRNTPAMSGFTTDYNTGFINLTNSPTTITASATLVQSFYCANATASAIQMVVTSGAFAWVGTTAGSAGYSVPAYSNVRFVSDSLGLFTTNIGAYSVTTVGIVCQIAGKQ